MSYEDTEILGFIQDQKSNKTRSIIYEDLESSTTNVIEHLPANI